MANTNAPFGFQQVQGLGTTPSYEQVLASVAYNTSAIYFGDPVAHISDGSVAGGTTSSLPGTNPLAGIFVGCSFISTVQKRRVWSNYWPDSDVSSANSPLEGYIVNDPNAQWLVQSSGSTGIALSNLGQFFQFAYGTGTTSNGISGAYLDATSEASTATLPFRVVSLVTPIGNTGPTTGEYNTCIVAFNNVETKTTNVAV